MGLNMGDKRIISIGGRRSESPQAADRGSSQQQRGRPVIDGLVIEHLAQESGERADRDVFRELYHLTLHLLHAEMEKVRRAHDVDRQRLKR
jgi:hypothetical protein